MSNYFEKLNNKGAAMMLFMMFFMIASIALTYSISRSVYAEVERFRLAYDSKQSYLAADAGIEDMAYRYIAGLNPDATEVISIGGAVATSTSVYDGVDDVYNISTEAVDNGAYRSSSIELFIELYSVFLSCAHCVWDTHGEQRHAVISASE